MDVAGVPLPEPVHEVMRAVVLPEAFDIIPRAFVLFEVRIIELIAGATLRKTSTDFELSLPPHVPCTGASTPGHRPRTQRHVRRAAP